MNYRGTVSTNPPGTGFARLVQALARGQRGYGNAEDIAAAQADWRTTPEVAMTLRSYTDPMSIDGSGSALAQYGIAREILDLLRNVSVVEKLKSRMFPTIFRTTTPIESTSPVGEWMSESQSISVTTGTFGSANLDPAKLGTIAVLTKELIERSGVNVESSIRRILTNALSYVMDFRFLSPTMTAISGLRPAAIAVSGAASVTSTGSTAALIQADLASMVAALTSWRDPVWIMRLSTLTNLQARNPQLVVYANGQPMLLGLPVFTSLGSPQQITLVDIASIMIADGNLDVSISDQASLEMNSQPLGGDESPLTTSVVMKSLWQAGLTGVRMTREISWARTLSSAVVVMTVSY